MKPKKKTRTGHSAEQNRRKSTLVEVRPVSPPRAVRMSEISRTERDRILSSDMDPRHNHLDRITDDG